ncbi:MAG: pentapeptide repeat-containing protein [Rhodospirillales bacterium]|nr:pentapeptide repeat-containing protein [Rhodospirillales bacterium]
MRDDLTTGGRRQPILGRGWISGSIATFLPALMLCIAVCAAPLPCLAGGPGEGGDEGACQAEGADGMTSAEAWVIAQLRAGKPADFERCFKVWLDPAASMEWTSARVLSSKFLRTLILDPTYSAARRFGGVRIVGAQFHESVDLQGVRFDDEVRLENCRFDQGMDLSRLKTSRTLSLRGSAFGGPVSLAEASIGDALLFNRAHFHDLNLSDADIGKSVRLSGAHLEGVLNMSRVDVRENVEAYTLAWNSVVPDQGSLGPGINGRWDLYDARIGGKLIIADGTLDALDMINLTGTRIDGELFLGSKDLPGNQWGETSRLVLRNAVVGSIQDLPDAWPKRLDLAGFAYQRWNGLQKQSGLTNVPARGSEWLIAWLNRDPAVSDSSYDQLARVLRQSGCDDCADDVQFHANDKRLRMTVRDEAWLAWLAGDGIGKMASFTTAAGANTPPPAPQVERPQNRLTDHLVAVIKAGALSLSRWVNGYGYQPALALRLFGVLILVGMVVFWPTYRSAVGSTERPWSRSYVLYSFEYTLDTMLPAVSLSKKFERVEVIGLARYYFIVLKVLGYWFAATIIQVFQRLFTV